MPCEFWQLVSCPGHWNVVGTAQDVADVTPSHVGNSLPGARQTFRPPFAYVGWHERPGGHTFDFVQSVRHTEPWQISPSAHPVEFAVHDVAQLPLTQSLPGPARLQSTFEVLSSQSVPVVGIWHMASRHTRPEGHLPLRSHGKGTFDKGSFVQPIVGTQVNCAGHVPSSPHGYGSSSERSFAHAVAATLATKRNAAVIRCAAVRAALFKFVIPPNTPRYTSARASR